MSRKEYLRMANVLAGEYAIAATYGDPNVRAHRRFGVENMVASLADVMAQDSPRFDRAKFYQTALGRTTVRP